LRLILNNSTVRMGMQRRVLSEQRLGIRREGQPGPDGGELRSSKVDFTVPMKRWWKLKGGNGNGASTSNGRSYGAERRRRSRRRDRRGKAEKGESSN
jgi:hypothetical protein